MKKFLILVLLNFAVESITIGRCLSSGYYVWPREKSLAKNSIFILTAYGNSQQIIQNISIYNVYLESYKDSIELIEVKIHTGEYGLTQIILKPSRNLITGQTYSLRISGLTGDEKNEFDRSEFKWDVKDEVDNDMPEWNAPPFFITKEWIAYGCGPEANTKFGICYNDQSPVIILARVKEISTGITSEYFVESDSTMLSIGHGMCYGAFYCAGDSKYEVSFSLMDASGNKIDSLTTPISFTGPTMADSIPIETICNCKITKVQRRKSSNNLLLYILASTMAIAGLVIMLKKKAAANMGFVASVAGRKHNRRFYKAQLQSGQDKQL